MNKKLLISALFMPFLAFSQSKDASKFGSQISGNPVSSGSVKAVVDSRSADSAAGSGKLSKHTPATGTKRGLITYNFVKIGSTYYDLQTNASIGRRVLLHSDGRVSAAWTTSNDAVYANRGTGYNHFDLTNWLTVGNPTLRLENTRLGWPSLGLNGSKEWVMGHDAANGGFIKSENASIGSTSWTQGSLVLNENNRRPIWGRMANSGNYFHAIASYADSSAAGEPRAPRINGVYAPMTYSRSTDGGNTWSTSHILLPGYDSSRVLNGGGDQYAIDVRDSIVTIVTGGLLEDVMMWKSTDNGNTFTMTICDTFPYAPYNAKKLMDPTFCSDGSLDVLIDNDGKAHIFWGVGRVLDTDTTDDSYSFFPSTSLLGYWNENTQVSGFIAGGLQFDRDGSDSIELSPGCWSSLVGGLVPQNLKNAGISSVARLGNTSLLHAPSAGIDANGNIFCTFSMPLEQDVDPNNVNLRDIYIVHSTDGGMNWSDPQDITQWQGYEEEFACVGKTVNDFVHVIFQQDATAGTNLQNNSNVDGNHPAGINDIYYAAVPVAKILDGSISTLQNASIKNFDANQEVFIVSQNYPNPFSNASEIIIWLDTESELTLEITNVSGQIISTQTFGSMGAGNHALTLNAEGLSNGIYFYTVKTATHAVTKKMSVN